MKLLLTVSFSLCSLALVGCENSSQAQKSTSPPAAQATDQYIDGVQNATLAAIDDSITIGDALNSYKGFTHHSWDRVIDEQNRLVVRFHGFTHDAFSKCKWIVNEKTYEYSPSMPCTVDGEVVVLFYISKAQRDDDKFSFKLATVGVRANLQTQNGHTDEKQLESPELLKLMYEGGDYFGTSTAFTGYTSLKIDEDSRLLPGQKLAESETQPVPIETGGGNPCPDPRNDNPNMRQIDALRIMKDCATNAKLASTEEVEEDCPQARGDDPDVDQAANQKQYEECMARLHPSPTVLAASPTPFHERNGTSRDQPSFDCRKASTVTEKAICTSPDLSALDNELDTVFRSHIAGVRTNQVRDVRADQKAWIEARDANCGGDQACLSTYLRDRISILQRRSMN